MPRKKPPAPKPHDDDERALFAWLLAPDPVNCTGERDPTKPGYGATIQQAMEFFDVKTEASKWVRFLLRPKQILILSLMLQCWVLGRVFRCVILKTRRYGITTFWLVYAVVMSLRIPGWRGSTVAKDEQDSEMFLSIVRQCVNQVPIWARPKTISRTKSQIIFQHGQFMESAVTVYSANKGGIGRGDTINMLHPTEVPYYSDRAKGQYYGAQPGLGKFAGNVEPWESTAQGYDAMFWAKWDAAHEPDEPETGSDFVRVFIAAYEHPNFYRPFVIPGEQEAFEADLGQQEKYGGLLEVSYLENLLIPYQQTGDLPLDCIGTNPEDRSPEAARLRALEQLHYCRFIQVDDCSDSLDQRKSDFPFTAEEAFVATGENFYDVDKINAWLPIAKEQRGTLGNFIERDNSVFWVATISGLWRMFQDREKGVSYCYGADTASGKQVRADGRTEADFATGHIIDTISGYRKAELRRHLKPKLHAQEVARASYYYGKAKGYVERSAVGDEGVMLARMEPIRIGEWWAIQSVLPSVRKIASDRPGKIRNPEIGWATVRGTKQYLMEGSRDYLDDEVGMPTPGAWSPISWQTLDEQRFYVRDPATGKLQASQGHADMCVSLSLALHARKVLLMHTKLQTKVEESEDEEVEFYKQRWASQPEVTQG